MLLRYWLVSYLTGSLTAMAVAQDFVAPTPDRRGADDAPERVVVTGAALPAYVTTEAVSATKTDASLLETPQTVNVIPRQLLDDQDDISLREALRNVGGVNVSGGYRDYDIYRIRGFEGSGFTYLDGLLVDRQQNFQEEPFGLERIEVIQGPASVLYGQNPPGGLVNLISKRPQKSNFTDLSVGGGSFDLVETSVDTNAVLNQSGSVYGRVNVLWRQFNTFAEYVDPSERVLVAPSLTIELTKRTKLTLLGQYYLNYSNQGFPIPAAGFVLPNRNGEVSIRRNIGEPDTFNTRNHVQRGQLGYQLEHRFNDVFTLRQNVRAGVYDVQFQGVYPGALEDDQRTLDRDVFISPERYTTAQADTSLAATFNTGTWAKHTTLIGVDFYYLHDLIKGLSGSIDPIDIFKPVYGAKAFDLTPALERVTDASQTGIYFQEQVKLFDRVSIVGGGRGDFVENDLTDRLGNTESDASPSAFSPRAGIVYEVLPKQVSTYFAWSRSFQSNPGYVDAGGNQLSPEEGEQFEIGAKADLFDGKLSSGLALYHITRTNVPTSDPTNPDTYITTGEERHRGVDFNTTLSLVKGWDLVAAYGYVDARVTADTTGLVGNRPLDVPEHTFNVFTKYTLQNGPLRGLGFGVGFRYLTRQAGDPGNTFSLPSYGVLDLAAYYRRGPFSAQVNVNNATDERYAAGSFDQTYVQPGDPVNVRGSIGWHF